jgi:hypothetical protein
MSYDASKRPRHPVQVAELNDANSLRTLVTRLDGLLESELTTAGARAGLMHARTILIGTIRANTP